MYLRDVIVANGRTSLSLSVLILNPFDFTVAIYAENDAKPNPSSWKNSMMNIDNSTKHLFTFNFAVCWASYVFNSERLR